MHVILLSLSISLSVSVSDVHEGADHDHDVFLGGGCLFKDGFPAQTSTTQEFSYMGRTIMG